MTALLREQGGTREAINRGQVQLSFANSSLGCKKGYRLLGGDVKSVYWQRWRRGRGKTSCCGSFKFFLASQGSPESHLQA